MSAADRSARTAAADELCARAWTSVDGPDAGAALVAVGGYGRSELAPHSDLDVVLVLDDGVDVGPVAADVWYPLWDSGRRIDHAVRSLPEMVAAADGDLRVAAGLLDVRHVAGDPGLSLRLRSTMLTQWRREARRRLPDLRDLVRDRHRRVGELAHLSVPDLKEAEGGLRDATTMRGLTATWLVDVQAADLERCRLPLLDVRDALHALNGRATDRIGPEQWAGLAELLELDGERDAQRHVRELGRRLTHLSRLAWRRVDDVLRRPVAGRARRPELEPVAAGVAVAAGEVVLDRRARPAEDPALLLRAAAAAAERDLVLAPPTAARLARECPPLPEPWTDEARDLLVRLLLSGRGLREVWETLEETGALARLLPEWERIRLLPHASVIHRFTVDRHVVETCVEAAALIRDVARPDVLAAAALLHDIGKGGRADHSLEGEPIARAVARRMGFDDDAVELVALLVRRHLLLAEVATTRDPDDPATLALVTDAMRTTEAVSLLTALTEADATATAPTAWTSWRAGLVLDLSRRARAALDDGVAPPAIPVAEVEVPASVRGGAVAFAVEPVLDGSRVTSVARDRVRLLADHAAVLARLRVPVRAARVWSQHDDGVDYGVSVWEVDTPDLDAAVLRAEFEAVADGRAGRAPSASSAAASVLAPSVVVRPEASDRATVIEVRADDQRGVVHRVCAALADLDVSVRSAHLSTLGPQAVDVFYVQEPSAGALSETRAADVAHAVRAALGGR